MQNIRSHNVSENQARLARGLGWFSVGLGLAEILAPKALARFMGVRPPGWLLPALGLREISSGVGILTQKQPTGWLWSRVAGDVMDLGLLGTAYAAEDSDEHGLEAAAAAVAGVTVLDVIAAVQHSQADESSVRFRRAVTINRTPEEMYRFWRNFENLPRVMQNLDTVRSNGDGRSHWVAEGPAGKKIEWDAEVTEDRPNEYIAWRSLPNAEVENSGWVSFERAVGDRGTIVRVELEYSPPGGTIGATVAKLFGKAPEQQIKADLYRLKQIMETGHVTTTEGQPAGRSSSTSSLYDSGLTRG